jgi:hypothetical protein
MYPYCTSVVWLSRPSVNIYLKEIAGDTEAEKPSTPVYISYNEDSTLRPTSSNSLLSADIVFGPRDNELWVSGHNLESPQPNGLQLLTSTQEDVLKSAYNELEETIATARKVSGK